MLEGIRHLSEHTAYLAVVTGQVDGDIDSYSEETRTYQKILGETQSEDRKCGRSDHGGGVRDPRTVESMKSRVWNSFKIACSMYSKIPVPPADWTKENKAYVMCFFPWVGGCDRGADLCRVFPERVDASGRLWISGFLFTALLVLIPVWVTGGIHLDGYLDTQDALHSYQSRERKLEILKDPHTGAFAVIAGICYFVLDLGIYSGLTAESVRVIAAGFVLSRALSGLSVVCFPQARKKGMAADFSDGAKKKGSRLVLILYVILAAGVMIFAGGVPGVAAVLAAGGVFLYYARMTRRIFGGMTGDLAGYFLQLCEIWMAAAAVIADILWKGAGW